MIRAYIDEVDDESKNFYLRWLGSYDYFYVTTFIYAVLTPLSNLNGQLQSKYDRSKLPEMLNSTKKGLDAVSNSLEIVCGELLREGCASEQKKQSVVHFLCGPFFQSA